MSAGWQPGLRADVVASRQGFFEDWRNVCGDAPDLDKYYELAEGMLGVVTQPRRTPADEAMGAIAVDLGVEPTQSTPGSPSGCTSGYPAWNT